MELSNEFTADLSLDRAWALLTDLARVAPCIPGAEVEAVEGDSLRGTFKVTVGRTTARYHGVARVIERDRSGHRVVVRAEGDESLGKGGAEATLTATFAPAGDATRVLVRSDVSLSGRFSRTALGTIAEAASDVLDEFVRCARESLIPDAAAGAGAPAAADGTGPGPAPALTPASQPSGVAPAPEATGPAPVPESTVVAPAPELAPLPSTAPTIDDGQVAPRSMALPAAAGLGLLLVVVWVLFRRHRS